MYSSKETLTGRARPEQLVQTSLKGIAKKAKRLKKYRFRDLYRQINHSALSKAWENINKKAAAGVDKITAKEFAKNLKDNVKGILDSLIGKRYHAKMVRRVNIEKDNGKFRPLGIPVVADKIVQRATADILEAIYEQDFIEDSYGYRPNRDSKVAIKSLTKELQFGKYSYIVEADIKGFFDNIDHDWLIKMLKQRVNDKEFIRLIKKWLKAGILKEDGQVIHPVTGTPQGGIISPILANIYLHYVLDIWFIRKVKKGCSGEAHLCRYADDFVCAFRYKRDAERFYHILQKRLSKFGLQLSLEKTNIISFSRFRKYENNIFEFLGFEISWGTSRKGKDIIKRRTSRKKLRKSLKNFTKWCKENRNKRLRRLFSELNSKLRGYYNYYGIIGNYKSLHQFYRITKRILYKWLNRRSQRRSFNWQEFDKVLDRYRMLKPRITEINQLGFEFS
jgi:group II intron reverse transcriptase/maturase